jgi:hypothetical protein
MKLRLGFVTNSSSTNHIIAWNGKKEDLRSILEAHKKQFPTKDNLKKRKLKKDEWDTGRWEVTSDEIIDFICSCEDNIEELKDFKYDQFWATTPAKERVSKKDWLLIVSGWGAPETCYYCFNTFKTSVRPDIEDETLTYIVEED